MEQDKQGNIYIGTHSGGLTLILKDGTTKTYHIEKDDAGVLIFNIHLDEQGKVWLVSNLGPMFFDGEKFKPIVLAKPPKDKLILIGLKTESETFGSPQTLEF